MRTGHAAWPVAGLLILASCAGDGGGSSSNAPDVARVQQGFVTAVERAVPAVVNIRTVTRFPRGGAAGAPEGGTGLKDYLAQRMEENGGVRENALGSGIRVGEWAIAVGNPFGLESTVTMGVISATGRTDLGADPSGDLIQTDASINPGNSGGPLLNTRGEVVGINTAMVSGGQGIGFAIPINTVLEIERELARTGTIRRGRLGVGIQLLSPELAESFGVKGEKGVLVNRVFPGSPAGSAGLRGGDIVISFGGTRVGGVKEFQKAVEGISPGTDVVLEILRGGKRMTVTVKLAEREGPAPTLAPRNPPWDAWGLYVKALPT